MKAAAAGVVRLPRGGWTPPRGCPTPALWQSRSLPFLRLVRCRASLLPSNLDQGTPPLPRSLHGLRHTFDTIGSFFDGPYAFSLGGAGTVALGTYLDGPWRLLNGGPADPGRPLILAAGALYLPLHRLGFLPLNGW